MGPRTPAVFHSGDQDSSQFPVLQMDATLPALLWALPTRVDIEALISRVDASHPAGYSGAQEGRAVDYGPPVGRGVFPGVPGEPREATSLQTSQSNNVIPLQLHMEEMEDQSSRNNLRLRGLPEDTGTESDHGSCDISANSGDGYAR